jgi:large subunit ribosomal protein L25
MESIELQIDPRSVAGKGASRKLRRAGKLPAILYGPKRETVSVIVDAKELGAKVASSRRSVLVRLRSENADVNDRLALVKELQCHPITGDVLHADFYEVDVKTKLRVRVPIACKGRAVGVELGGILQPILREVEVLCLPSDIPDVIEVDVSSLGIHDVVHMSDLQPPPGVEVQFDSDEPIVTVLAPTVEEVKVEAPSVEEAAPAAEGASAPTEPKGEEKKG